MRQLERQATSVRLLADIDRRRPAGVHQHHHLADLDALVTGMRRVRQRCTAGVVVGENGRHQIGQRRSHAVEVREGAVAVPEETHHRHHAVDRVVELRRRRQVARLEGLTQRQEVEQQLDQRSGLRLTWPPSARIWRSISVMSCLTALRMCRACPAMQSAA